MPEPLISTIIPTYKRPHLLKRAIRSVQEQTYPHIRICIYDNASGDGTREVVAALQKEDPCIEYHCHSHNIGLAGNFAFGLEQVTTPFFSCLSDDDLIFPDFYETALHALENAPEAGFFAGLTLSCTEDGKVVSAPLDSWSREGIYDPPEGFIQMASGKHPTWTGILFRRVIRDTLGGFDTRMDALLDLDFQLRAAAHYPFIVSKKKCAIFLRHSGSVSANYYAQDCQSTSPQMLLREKILKLDVLPLETKLKVLEIGAQLQQQYLLSVMKESLKQRDFRAFEIFLSNAHNLPAHTLRSMRRRYFLTKRLPLIATIWTKYKELRKSLKRLINKNPTTHEKLRTEYGEYAAWLKK